MIYLYNYSAQINRFTLKTAVFLAIRAKCYQISLPECIIWVSQAKRTVFLLTDCSKFAPKRYSPNCTIYVSKPHNFTASERATSPSDIPCAQMRNSADVPPNHPLMSRTDLRSYVLMKTIEFTVMLIDNICLFM